MLGALVAEAEHAAGVTDLATDLHVLLAGDDTCLAVFTLGVTRRRHLADLHTIVGGAGAASRSTHLAASKHRGGFPCLLPPRRLLPLELEPGRPAASTEFFVGHATRAIAANGDFRRW